MVVPLRRTLRLFRERMPLQCGVLPEDGIGGEPWPASIPCFHFPLSVRRPDGYRNTVECSVQIRRGTGVFGLVVLGKRLRRLDFTSLTGVFGNLAERGEFEPSVQLRRRKSRGVRKLHGISELTRELTSA